jgi:L-asparagine transporter-like permease
MGKSGNVLDQSPRALRLLVVVRKTRSERAAELAPTGMLRSPLYWMSSALALLLIVLVLYITHIHHQSPVPVFLWFTVFAIIVALLFLRRALKWRYPV